MDKIVENNDIYYIATYTIGLCTSAFHLPPSPLPHGKILHKTYTAQPVCSIYIIPCILMYPRRTNAFNCFRPQRPNQSIKPSTHRRRAATRPTIAFLLHKRENKNIRIQ
ncbi:hypothetical protein CC80DRAFT_168798 [Byssothecium circinans]|uniref:Uncharacterized protein n=1 Tax=Byssothecium circinans TaxID=147558 RepID=A0A6A5TL52_9PLEO|nr:hypothetical protein CC80DRAFT_168798 [Byssothecium circinans]